MAKAEASNIFIHYCKFLLVIVLMNIMLFKSGRSEVYTVGDEQGWNSDSNFDSWSQKYNFSAGDILVFKYVKGQHNVYEVKEATYRSCDTSNGGIIAKYESGNDRVKLTQQKKYWFICNIDGHCLGGMRFNIQSNSTSNEDKLAPPIIPIQRPPPPPNTSSSFTSYNFLHGRVFFICLVALAFLIQFYH